METNTWIALATLTLAGLGFVIGLFKYFTGKIDDLRKEEEKKIAEAIKQGDDKRARLYDRLDEIKKVHKEEIEKIHRNFADTYVNSKMCSLVHNNTDNIIKEMKIKIDEMDKKIDRLVQRIPVEKND